MGRKTNSKKTSAPSFITKPKSGGVLRNKSHQFWAVASTDEWFSYITREDPSGQWKKHGDSLKGLCRAHNDHNPSLHVYPHKGYARCYSCGFYTPSPIKLLNSLTNKSPSIITAELQKQFDAKVFKGKQLKELEAYEQHNKMKKDLFSLISCAKRKAISLFMNEGVVAMENGEYHFAIKACEYLDYRKVLDICMTSPVGIVPPVNILEAQRDQVSITEEEFKNMMKYANKLLEPERIGHVLFAPDAEPGIIGRFRTRNPEDSQDKKKIMFALDDPYEEDIGLFGFSMYLNLQDSLGRIGKTKVAYMVEGEFDVLQMAQQQKNNNCTDAIFVSHGGGANHNTSHIANYGIKTLYYIPDYDTAGIQHAHHILKNNTKTEIRIHNWPFKFRPAVLEESIDLDTALLKFGFQAVMTELRNVDANFVKREVWCREKCIEEIKEKEYEDNIKALKRTVAEWSLCLGEDAGVNQTSFISDWIVDILKKFGVEAKTAEKVATAITAEEDPEMSFLLQLEDKLKEAFAFLSVEVSSANKEAWIWDKRKKTLALMKTNSASDINTFFGSSLGPWYDWCSREIGDLDLLQYGRAIKDGENIPEKLPILQREKYAQEMSHLAVKKILAPLSPKGRMLEYKDGNHFLKADTGMSWFVVNGHNVFLGKYDKNANLTWEQLDKPLYDNYYFRIEDGGKYSEFINCLDDLKNATPVDIPKIFPLVHEIVKRGWTFENQEYDSMFIATLPFLIPILPSFPKNIQLFASAERNSGKTTLVAKFLGNQRGEGKPSVWYSLVEHAEAHTHSTPAGAKQLMTGNSKMLILDETDNTENNAATEEKNQMLQLLFRILSTEDGASMIEGTSGGSVRKRSFGASLVFAGIFPKIANSNLTRLHRMELKSVASRLSPAIVLKQFYSKEMFAELRKGFSVGMFSHVPEIHRHLAEIEAFFSKNPGFLSPAIEQRWKDTLYIQLAIIKAAGLDWKKAALEYSKSKLSHFEVVSHATTYNFVWNHVKLTQGIRIKHVDTHAQEYNVMELISRSADKFKINESNCGVWYWEDSDTSKKYLIVNWQIASSGVLRNCRAVQSLSPQALKERAINHPNCLPVKEVNRLHPIIFKKSRWVRPMDISILDITDELKGVNDDNSDEGDEDDKKQTEI